MKSVNFIAFVSSSALLGVGLAMDAFSVSVANGLKYGSHEKEADPDGGKKSAPKDFRLGRVPLCFTFFHFLMPMIGWFCVHSIVEKFNAFRPFIPWIALFLLLFIGGKMLIEGIKGGEAADEEAKAGLGFAELTVQGIAISIDALSVGFTTADHSAAQAFAAAAIIAAVTWIICVLGLKAGTSLGEKLAGRSGILGGAILILIGIKVFIEGVFL